MKNFLREQWDCEEKLSFRMKKEDGKEEMLDFLVFCLDNPLYHIPHFVALYWPEVNQDADIAVERFFS